MDERSPRIAALKQPAQHHQALPFTAVDLQDGLWAPRQTVVRSRTVPFLYAQYEKNGLFEALDVMSSPGRYSAHHLYFSESSATVR